MKNQKVALYLLSGFLASILIRIYLIAHSLEVADVGLMHIMVNKFVGLGNPYVNPDFYIYPPLGVGLEYIALKISQLSGLEFSKALRILPSLADLLMGFLIYKLLIKTKVKQIVAALWSIFYLLNPISIMISTLHGQLDSVPTLLILLAAYLILFGNKSQKLYLSSFFLGLSFAIKPSPIVLLPFFLFYHELKLKQIAIYLFIAFAPLVLSMLPFLTESFRQVIESLISYQGSYDFGYAALLRSLWYQNNANYWLPFDLRFADLSKYTILFGYLVVFFALAKSKNLIKTCLIVFLFLYAFYFNISAQFYIWALPFIIIEKKKFALFYTVFCTIALLGFYLFFSPSIIFGDLTVFKAFQSEMLSIYFFGNLLLWLLVIYWFFRLLVDYFKKEYPKLSFIHKRVILVVLILFVVSIAPTISLWQKIQREINMLV